MKRGKATLALVAILIGVFVLEVASGVAGSERALVGWGALLTREWSNRDWWRVLTFSFLHHDVVHIALNTAGLLWLGSVVERRLGSASMLAVFAGGAIGSGVAGVLLGPLLPTTGVALGASGALCGLLGAALLLVFRTDTERRLRAPLLAATVVVTAISFLPGVSLSGHMGGFVGGLGVGALLASRPDHRTQRDRLAH